MDRLGISFVLLCFWGPTLSEAANNADSFAHTQEMFEQRLRMHSRHHWNNLSLKRIHKARRRNATCMGKQNALFLVFCVWKWQSGASIISSSTW